MKKKIVLVNLIIVMILNMTLIVMADVGDIEQYLSQVKEVEGDSNINNSNYYGIHKDSNSIWCYIVNMELFNRFVVKPEGEVLNCVFVNPKLGYIYEYSNIYYSDGMKILLNGDKYYIDKSYKGNEVLEGYFNLYGEWFDFIKEDNLQRIIKENGINEKLINRTFVIQRDTETSYLREPVILWLQTDVSNYFLVYDLNDVGELINAEAYKLYNYDEFYSRFRLKTGSINFNSDNLIKDVVIFQDKNVYLPVRILLENLGSEVSWNSEKRGVEFTMDERKYIYLIDRPSHNLARVIDGNIQDFKGESITRNESYLLSSCMCEFINNGSIYISLTDMEYLTKAFSSHFDVDYGNLIVEIR